MIKRYINTYYCYYYHHITFIFVNKKKNHIWTRTITGVDTFLSETSTAPLIPPNATSPSPYGSISPVGYYVNLFLIMIQPSHFELHLLSCLSASLKQSLKSGFMMGVQEKKGGNGRHSLPLQIESSRLTLSTSSIIV